MLIWRRLLQNLGLRPARGTVRFDQVLYGELQLLADRERRPAEDVASDLLADALQQRQAAEDCVVRWQCLSVREQQVTALICLDFTNPQISRRLNVSLPTVKAHVRSVLRKFNLQRREDLRYILSGWDFSAWQ